MDESWFDGKHVDARDRFRPVLNTGFAPCLIGTAVYGPVRTVVWDPGANHSRGPDSASYCLVSFEFFASHADSASLHCGQVQSRLEYADMLEQAGWSNLELGNSCALALS
jgi:hypothetical protein